MNIKSMSRTEKKELLRTLYLNDYGVVREVIEELAAELASSNDLSIPDNEKKEIEQIVDAHFKEYADVFKALA